MWHPGVRHEMKTCDEVLTWKFYSEFKCAIFKWCISWTKYHCIPFHKIVLTFTVFKDFTVPLVLRNFTIIKVGLENQPWWPWNAFWWIFLNSFEISHDSSLRRRGHTQIFFSFQNYRRLVRALRRLSFQPTIKLKNLHFRKYIIL